MTRISIIGANGFIGSHLVDAFVHLGHKVTAFDRFSSANYKFSCKPENVIKGDFLDTDLLETALRGAEIVFHCLSLTNPAARFPTITFDNDFNVSQSIRLIEIASQLEVQHFYFMSSGGTIYGSQSGASLSEESPTKPLSPYGIGKLSVEGYLRYFGATTNMKTTSFRISNPYGPRQTALNGQGLIPNTIQRMLAGKPAIRFGDGSMTRDYIFISDLVEMIVNVYNSSSKSDVYNLGSGQGVSVNQIFELLSDISGIPIEIEEYPQPATFVQNIVLDITKYKTTFGSPVFTTISEGLATTYFNNKTC